MVRPADPLDPLFQALADPTRRGVVEELAHGDRSVSELAEPFDMALPSFLQHLRVLEASGLIRSTKRGRVRTCELVPDALGHARDWMARQQALWENRLDLLDATLVELHRHEREHLDGSQP